MLKPGLLPTRTGERLLQHICQRHEKGAHELFTKRGRIATGACRCTHAIRQHLAGVVELFLGFGHGYAILRIHNLSITCIKNFDGSSIASRIACIGCQGVDNRAIRRGSRWSGLSAWAT